MIFIIDFGRYITGIQAFTETLELRPGPFWQYLKSLLEIIFISAQL